MRSKKTPIKKIQLDTIYSSDLVSKLINSSMLDGKKSLAANQVYKAIDILAEKSGKDGLEYLQEAIENLKPTIEVRSRRVGGASYQVPAEVRGERRVSLAVRWIITAAEGRSNKEFHTFAEKLAAELLDASQNLGNAIKKRDTIQKVADANRAFAHFRW